MFKHVDKLFIGKDIDRTVALVDGAEMDVIHANILEGEVVVLDENFKIAAATVTYSDTKTIYIAEGSSDTFDYANEAGTAVTGARRLLISDPIDGSAVTSYIGSSYVAKAEETYTIPAISGTITAGTEYVLRIVYKDMVEHPGQFTSTYRYTAKAGDDSTDIFDGLRARIAKHTGKMSIGGGARILGSGTTTLVLTAKPIPQSTSSVNSIDELSMVEFAVFFNYVDNDGNWEAVPLASAITHTAGTRGVGSWEGIRDIEKHALAYRGITNLTWFPVIRPDMRVVKGATYDVITIESNRAYRSPDNQYMKSTPLTTIIALEVDAAGSQSADVLTRLNAWMETVPGAFANVTV